MSKRYTYLLLLCFFPALVHAQTEEKESPLRATLCELYEHPEQYAGKIVSVRARVVGNNLWIDSLEQKACPSWTQVVVVFPEQLKLGPGFALVRDDSLAKLLEGANKGKGVQATFEGRFDVAFVWRNHKKVPVGTDEGYGKKHRYGGRIVLERVSDVLVLPGSRL